MRCCETCGAELGQTEPFAVCPKCLFASALETQGAADSSRMLNAGPTKPCFDLAPRLMPRRDFFEKYEILERVAEGGQGGVWKVRDFELRRCVAMKRLTERALGSPAAVHRFLAEAQIASQLEHPGILPIFDVGLDPDGRPFYTTQLLPGRTLGDIWQLTRDPNEREWNTRRAVELLIRVCEIMSHAHSRGVIHRDLKPSNILVGPFGDVRVIDWGSAHVLETARPDFQDPFVTLDPEAIQTDRGELMLGTPDSALRTASAGHPITVLFMPPEVLRGGADQLAPQTDIYSMGVMLYELLAGRPPYATSDGALPEPTQLKEQILSEAPVSILRLNRTKSRDLAAICQKAMAPLREDRYRLMRELGDDLRAALEVRPVQARRPGLILRLQKWLQRHAIPVVWASLALSISVVAFVATRGVMAERNLARQLSALRSAELAARTGQWRAALRHWQDAESTGHADAVELGLRRAEAWTVLSSPQRARAELEALLRRSDLGARHGQVLLRAGEHELFDSTTPETGLEHVRAALTAGLFGGDLAFARGLLAESTPAALDFFRETLRFDPYHHGAHRHSLGLEFTLGRREELAAHLRVFKVLFPDDPSGGFLEAAELALGGRIEEATACLTALRTDASPEYRQRLMAGFRGLAAAKRQFDLDAMLSGETNDAAVSPLAGVWEAWTETPGLKSVNQSVRFRLPQLPCLRSYQEGWRAVHSLALPIFKDPTPVAARVRGSWRSHPEALMPASAARFLEQWQPEEGPRLPDVLAIQAELFKLAAGSPSLIPGLNRWARYHAIRAQFELAGGRGTNDTFRRDCLDNLWQVARAAETSAIESRACFDMAFALREVDLARALLFVWERQAPMDSTLARARIQLEVAVGAFGQALTLLDQLSRDSSAKTWVAEQRALIQQRLQEQLRPPAVSVPQP